MTSQTEQEKAIVRFEGQPQAATTPKKVSRWNRFCSVFAPWFLKKAELADDLAERAAEAEVGRKEEERTKTEQEALKFGAEAAEAAARADVKRQEAAKAHCELVNEHVAPSHPELAAMLKLAKILGIDLSDSEKLAACAEQLSDIEDRLKRLNYKRTLRICAIDTPPALPASEEAPEVEPDEDTPESEPEDPKAAAS